MNDLSQIFFCIPDSRLLITSILSILKPDVMDTKGCFQDDEKTIIDIDIDMDIVAHKKRKMCLYLFKYFLKNLEFQNWLNIFVGEK